MAGATQLLLTLYQSHSAERHSLLSFEKSTISSNGAFEEISIGYYFRLMIFFRRLNTLGLFTLSIFINGLTYGPNLFLFWRISFTRKSHFESETTILAKYYLVLDIDLFSDQSSRFRLLCLVTLYLGNLKLRISSDIRTREADFNFHLLGFWFDAMMPVELSIYFQNWF